MKVKSVIKQLEDDGWVLKNAESSHRQYEHPQKPGKVTVPGKLGDDVPSGTLGNICRQSGLRNLGR